MLSELVKRLAGASSYTLGSRVALACIGLAILWRVLTVAPGVPFLYIELAELPLTASTLYLLHAIWGVAALGLILNRFTRECTLIALLIYWMDAQAGLQNAGSYLARIVLIYALFLDGGLMRGRKRVGLRVFLHNLAVIAIIVQLCIVYINASIWKFMGPDNPWTQGTMLYYITHQERFGLGWTPLIFEIPIITYAVTYLTVAYQLLFVLLLLTRWHWVSVIIGVGFHTGIALVMGLVPFGFIMTGLVLLSVRDKTYQLGWAWLAKKLPFISELKRQTHDEVSGAAVTYRLTKK